MKIISTLAMLFLTTLMFATTTAWAGGDGHNPPPPTPMPPTPAPTPVIDDNLSVAVLGFVGGEGMVNWSGAEGFGAVQKTSVLDMVTDIAYRKNTDPTTNCPGGCDDNVVRIGIHGQETILTDGGALSTNSGEEVRVVNSSIVQQVFDIKVTNMPAPPAAPAPSDSGGSD